MKNILIVGPPRTGKSTLANEFKNRFGYKVIEIDKKSGDFNDIVGGSPLIQIREQWERKAERAKS